MQIHTLDLNFQGVPQAIASYLIEGPSGYVLVETGPGSTLPTLKAKLAQHNITPQEIQALIVTHIHLDHAGAAGWWTQQGVPLYVHEFGVKHIIDPSRLLASASRIYGDKMDSLWGTMVPANPDLVTPLQDGDTVEAAGLTFTAIETPGHARHHYVIALEDVAFTGDAAGIHIHGSWVDLPAPPPEFDLEAWLQTIEKLQTYQFNRFYLTHFDVVDNVSAHLEQLAHILPITVQQIKQDHQVGYSRDEMVERYVTWSQAQAKSAGISDEQFHRYATANPHYMSVDGILRYLQKQEEKKISK